MNSSFELQISDHMEDVNVKEAKNGAEESFL